MGNTVIPASPMVTYGTGGGISATGDSNSKYTVENIFGSADTVSVTPSDSTKSTKPLANISPTYQAIRSKIFQQLGINLQTTELNNGQPMRGVSPSDYKKIIAHINRPENKANQRQLLLEWHAIFKPNTNHIIIDKPNKVLYGYQKGREVQYSGKMQVITGKSALEDKKGNIIKRFSLDKKTVAVKGAGKYHPGDRNTTGAGIYIMSKGRPYTKDRMRDSYDANNAIRLVHASAELDKGGYVTDSNKIESMVFHQVPGSGKTGRSKERYDALISNTLSDNAMTGGCPNIGYHEFEDIQRAGLTKPGSRFYVLPEEPGLHSFKVNRYGELIFTEDRELKPKEGSDYNYYYGRQSQPQIALGINRPDKYPDNYTMKEYYLDEQDNNTDSVGNILSAFGESTITPAILDIRENVGRPIERKYREVSLDIVRSTRESLHDAKHNIRNWGPIKYFFGETEKQPFQEGEWETEIRDKIAEIDQRPPLYQPYMDKLQATTPLGEIVATDFMATLEEHSASLMKDLRLSPTEYTHLARTAYGVLANESEFGTGLEYHLKEFRNRDAANEEGNKEVHITGQDLVLGFKQLKNCGAKPQEEIEECKAKITEEGNSRGLTQIKERAMSDEAKRLFTKYNITPDNLHRPDKSAIGTLIFLATNYKDMLKGEKKLARFNERDTQPLNLTEDNVQEYMAYLHKWPQLVSSKTIGLDTPTANKGAAYVAQANKEASYITGLIQIP